VYWIEQQQVLHVSESLDERRRQRLPCRRPRRRRDFPTSNLGFPQQIVGKKIIETAMRGCNNFPGRTVVSPAELGNDVVHCHTRLDERPNVHRTSAQTEKRPDSVSTIKISSPKLRL
jgi:hypothetical protein